MARNPSGLTTREQQVAVRAAEGLANKVIAYDLGIAEGTVAAHLSSAMRKLGVRRRSAIPGRLFRRARAPTTELPLTPAERDVTSALEGGWTNRQIGHARGVSERTIANQLASIYRKLGVASRTELLYAIATR